MAGKDAFFGTSPRTDTNPYAGTDSLGWNQGYARELLERSGAHTESYFLPLSRVPVGTKKSRVSLSDECKSREECRGPSDCRGHHSPVLGVWASFPESVPPGLTSKKLAERERKKNRVGGEREREREGRGEKVFQVKETT